MVSSHQAGGPVHPVGAASTRRTSSSRSPRWPGEGGCSSTATAHPASSGGPGLRDHRRLFHGGGTGAWARTVSSAASSRRLEAGTPGGPRPAAAPGRRSRRATGPSPFGRPCRPDRGQPGPAAWSRPRTSCAENERHILAARAPRSRRTRRSAARMSPRCFDGGHGPAREPARPTRTTRSSTGCATTTWRPSARHQEHNQPHLTLPTSEPALRRHYPRGLPQRHRERQRERQRDRERDRER